MERHDVPAAMNQALYSSNQQSFQQGDVLYTVGGYDARTRVAATSVLT